MDWKIYYDDGVFSSDHSFKDLPSYGVICLIQPDKEVGRTILHRWDYYVFRNDKWYGHHLDGLLLEFLYHANEIKAVKAGRTIETKLYREILQTATEDKDFPVKSANKTGEAGNERVL